MKEKLFNCILILYICISAAAQNSNETRQVNVTFERFMDLNEINEYMDQVVASFPELANVEHIGESLEGRPIRGIKISKNNDTRPAVLIDAGIHAAEWLGPSTAMYAIHQLTSLAQENEQMLDLVDWYIFPMINPDGYLYSWTHERKWRKNRRPNQGSNCTGVDLNRNFNVSFEAHTETDPCAVRFPGPHAYSEPEAKAFADFMSANSKNIQLYLALHTYGPYLLFPFGYKNEAPSKELVTVGEEAAAAAKKLRGTVYRTASIPELFNITYGSTMDLAYDVFKIPFTYVWELPPGPVEKLIPPPTEILPAAREVWEGFKVMVRRSAEFWEKRKIPENVSEVTEDTPHNGDQNPPPSSNGFK